MLLVSSGILSLLMTAVILLIPERIAMLFISDAGNEILAVAVLALELFSLTYLTRWFSFATQSYMLAIEKPLPASVISVSTALVFPLLLILALWPLGLTGIWLNLTGTSLLAGILSLLVLIKLRKQLTRADIPSEAA